MKKWYHNSYLELICRWAVGCVFVYASFHKIADPAVFAKSVYSYGLFPSDLINFIAISLPYVELLTGLFLLLGVYPRGAIFILNGLLVMFIALITVNFIRGHQFDCGCFNSGETPDIPTKWLLFRDVVYLVAGLFVYAFKGERVLCLGAESPR